MGSTLIKVEDLCKVYNPGENEVHALDHVNLEIQTGEFVAIIGQSGSGKSTFMNMLGRVGAVVLMIRVFHLGFVSLAWANMAGWILMLLFEVPLLIRSLKRLRQETERR